MPLPSSHSLASPQWLIDDATGKREWYCNCGSQPAHRTLRWAGNNRANLSVSAATPTVSTPAVTPKPLTIQEPAK